jgi:hypothetical protein
MLEARAAFEKALAESRYTHIVAVWREQLVYGVEHVNSQLALLQADADRWPTIQAEMATDGLYDVLGKDSAAIRGLAYLGLIQSVGATDDARALFEASGLSYDETIKSLEDADRRTGLPILHRSDDVVLVLI